METSLIIIVEQWALAYASLMSTVLLFALDNTIVSTFALTSITAYILTRSREGRNYSAHNR